MLRAPHGPASIHHSSFIILHFLPGPRPSPMWLDGYIDWFVVLIAVWLASVGGVIGSFLNVVVYRLPLGMSLVHPGSRCSVCLTPIRWYDNLPVVGWLWLRGRCRACGSQISARYPLVEGLVSAFFVLLFLSEFTCGGAREPWSAARAAFHAPWASDLSATQVWMRYWIQVLLAVTLLAAALIERDGRPVPPRLFWPTLAFSFAIPWMWRDARPLAFDSLIGPTSGVSPQFAQPLDLMLGAWVALVAALCAWRFLECNENGSRPAGIALLAIGLTLGWQLTAIISAVWLTTLLFTGTGRRSLPSLAMITATVLLAWRPVVALVAQFAQR
jgi:hypothetical protein